MFRSYTLSCFYLLFLFTSEILFSQTPSTPTITIPYGTATVCALNLGQPGSVLLVSSATSGNVWSNGATTQSINATSSGTYFVTQVVGNYTSSPSAPVTVSIHPIPMVTLVPIGTVCVDSPPIVLQGLPSGLSGSYNYSGSGVTGNKFIAANANIGSNNIISFGYVQTFGNDVCADSSTIRVTVLNCVTGIDEQKKQGNEILIYPSRDPGQFLIRSQTEKISAINITDLNGKEIIAIKDLSETETNFDLSDYSPGIYLVTATFDLYSVKKKIVKLE